MDAARMAAMSDPARNFHFSRRWQGPPLDRSGPRIVPTIQRAKIEDGSSDMVNTSAARLLQAACFLDRLADQELAIGRVNAAERLAHEAQALREATR
jgi:hypothetical protein